MRPDRWILMVLTLAPLALLAGHVGAHARVTVEGLVQGLRFVPAVPDGRSYHLLHAVSSVPTSDGQIAEARAAVVDALSQRGYGSEQSRLLDADIIVVLRFGAHADTPSVDDILSGRFEPEEQLPTGTRFVHVEAYDLPGYLAFVERNRRSAASDVHHQFMLWQTLVESRGEIAAFSTVLPTLLRIGTEYLGANTAGVRTFSDPA